MAAEIFKPWVPIDGLPQVLYVEALHDDHEGLRVLLRSHDPTGRTLRLIFEAVVGYRNINESYRLSRWVSPAMKEHQTLLTVKHSRWVEQLVAEAGGILTAEQLTHYAIYSPEDCIDLVTQFAPDVHWL